MVKNKEGSTESNERTGREVKLDGTGEGNAIGRGRAKTVKSEDTDNKSMCIISERNSFGERREGGWGL